MDGKSIKCDACGSSNVVLGGLGGTDIQTGRWGKGAPGFVLNEVRERPIRKFFGFYGPVIPTQQQGDGLLCVDCGNVRVTLIADVKTSQNVLRKWATDDVRKRLGVRE